jgi:hypothetical protein
MSAGLVSLLVVGAGQCTPLCCGSEMAVVPAEGGCCVFLSAFLVAVPGARAGIPGAGVGISGTGVVVSVAEGRFPEAGAEVVPLSA